MDYTVENCELCDALVRSRTRIVNGTGADDTPLVFVGEAPGADEDERGEPFVGRSGGILTEKLGAVGVSRDDVRITNAVRCRPPDNRDPYVTERENCSAYLEDEIESVDPEVVCPLGRVPTNVVLGRSVTLGDVVGKEHQRVIGGEERAIVPCYHPAAMLYDRSKEDSIDSTLSEVVALAGL